MGEPTRFSLWVNGTRREISEADAQRPLSWWLRHRCHLTGTKVACGAGECGSCTVLVARPSLPLHWMALNSCLLMPAQLHDCHVRTIEGVCIPGELSPVQDALIAGHGLQCGYCTPGFVMAMTGALQGRGEDAAGVPDRAGWRAALAGNLCRCTGYDAILAAAEKSAGVARAVTRAGASPFPTLDDEQWVTSSRAIAERVVASGDEYPEEYPDSSPVWRPRTLLEALRLRARAPERVVIAGGTDLMPARADGAGVVVPVPGLLVGHLPELQGCIVSPADHDGRADVRIAAATTWAELGVVLAPILPQVVPLIERVGNPQTRRVATIGGQVATASAIGDLLPLFLVLDATLTVASATESQALRLESFLQAPTATLHGALLTEIALRLPAARGTLLVEKASRRHDGDIATISTAAYVELDGTRIVHAALAVGGAGPRAQRLTQAEDTLVGATLGADVADRAVQAAQAELSPWSDVRASAAHRRMLVAGLIGGMLTDLARRQAEGHP